ncbi:hypothetical protein VPHD518_0023 [Vibrio phage D518]
MNYLTYPDEVVENQPTAFDMAKDGWHHEVLTTLPKKNLGNVMNFLGAASVKEAIEAIPLLSKEEYFTYLGMLGE